LTAEIDGREAVICVSDTGIGIPTEMLTHIFAMFTQVDDSIERSHGGLGIGLSLVKALVEMHGGTVTAASPGRGEGSVFTVRLPLGQEAVPGLPASSGGPVTTRRPLRIIVVDDNVDAARTLGKVLELKHHQVTVVNDSRSAITTIERERPDLVLLDLGLPEISGYDVAKAIRKHEWSKSVYISALTGWGQEEDRNRTREAGFDHHFVKPVEMAALFALLDKISVS
jgi:CheY-like chemotaxis protein